MIYILCIWAAISMVAAINARSKARFYKAQLHKEEAAHRETERRLGAYTDAADACGAELARALNAANKMHLFALPMMQEADPDWAFRANCPATYDSEVMELARKVDSLHLTLEGYPDVFYYMVGERIKKNAATVVSTMEQA